ncbi:MAG: flagellar biosynthetic protein FliO [Chitinispirillia bacterium]|nr:flagellar biosynthetic protein FliO [Chitinispirillia bacterium]
MNQFRTVFFPILIFLTAVNPALGQDAEFDAKFSSILSGQQSYDDTAFAAGTAADESFPAIPYAQPENYAIIILRMVGYLAIVMMVIFAAAWGIRKIGFVGTSKVGGGGNMDVIEVLSFGQNRNAVLVRVADTVYLLGQTPESMVLLEKIEGQKAIDLIASSKGGTSVMNFKEAFNSFIGKMKK